MGQVLGPDKIGTLSESSGTITLGPSRLTIGGQQYVTSSLNVTADLSTRNTRYQIYAVVSIGSVILVISTNENSVGPAGYNSWKLVGSYYSNGFNAPAGFGSFVNITGSPNTRNIAYSPGTLNLGATSSAAAEWSRDGQFMHIELQLIFSAGGAAATAGISVPINTLIDTANLAVPTGSLMGSGSWFDASVTQEKVAQLHNADNTYMYLIQHEEGGNALQGNEVASGDYMRMKGVRIPIVGWSNTAIEDL